MTCVAPLPYTLEDTCPVPWNEAAEGHLHHDYPFSNQDSSVQDFVIRRYLETLWLPESFSPLSYLIHSLRRIASQSSLDAPEQHPLHSLLEPVLLSTRAASDKYRTELVQILADGGGAGEQEETMMWYAYELEKAENEEDGAIDEEKWRKTWLGRLERREVMIQILLLMLKVSLPPAGPIKLEKGMNKKNKGMPSETIENRLESYMDKLAVWQLTGTLGSSQPSSQSANSNKFAMREDLHWTQTFYEDVVTPLFKDILPEQCELLRSKLYADQTVSDQEESEAESLLNGGTSRSGSRAPSVTRARLTRAPSTSQSNAPHFKRSRSRSLSVTLAQDEASQRASVVAPKQTLSREVSMSRILKQKPKIQSRAMSSNDTRRSEAEKPKIKRDAGMMIVQETPMKPKRSGTAGDEEGARNGWGQCSEFRFSVPSPPATSSSEAGDFCIQDTPVAARIRQSGDGVDSLSPLTPLPDETLGVTLTAEKVKTRGRKTSALKTSRVSARKSQKLQSKPQATMVNSTHDEHADGSFIDSFKLSKVTVLEEDDNHAMLVSPSPVTRTTKCSFFGLGGDVNRAGPLRDSAEDVDMATPTKTRTRRQ